MSELIGSVIKGYEVREKIGSGGFGAVYRAFQPVIEREVAVKIILPEYANQAEFIRGFEAEAQIVAHLEHPYIVPLYDYWRDPDGAFLVMRYLRAGSLSKHLRQSPLDPTDVLRMVEQISSALATAHRNGVVHRDLKPDNILLDDENNAFLTDFGIAKLVGNDMSDQGVSGSLRYIAPEQLRAEPTTIASDIYSFGLMIFEMLTGQYPFGELTPSQLVMKHLEDPIPDIRDALPNLPEAVNRVLQKATEKISEQRYTDAREIARELRAAFNQTVSVDFESIQNFSDVANPYKGLRPFQEADAADFFGRDVLVAQLLERLSDHHPFQRFLAVVGPSGSGKSSVVRAGVIPALRSGALSSANKWFMVDMVPGSDPTRQLESALLSIALRPPPRLYEMLTADENGLLWAVDRVLADSDSELLLVIDQFEEVFTNVESEEVRDHFLRSLQKAVSSPDSRLRLIITLRADFTDRPLEYVEFGELMRQRTEFILPLSALEIESAIIGPAQRVGLQVDSSLVSQIVADVREEPGALPLLQYALTEVFERREGNRLTLEAYLESGGVLGALARRAEELYVSLEPEAQRIVRQMLLRLVTLGEGTEDTRRRSRRSEIAEVVKNSAVLQSVLDQFGHYRLLTFDFESGTREPTLEVAHEALIREWQRLRGWLDSSRADLRLQRVLASEAGEWEKNNRDTSFLLSGARLSSYEEWMAATDFALTNREQSYIEASIEERGRRNAAEEERKRREEEIARRADQFAKRAQQLRRAATLLGIVGALAVVAVIFAITQVTSTQIQVAAGETQIAGVQPTLEIAQNRIDGAQTQIAGVQPTLEVAQNQINNAQTQVAGIQPTVTAAQMQIDGAQTQIAGVQPTLAAGQTQVAGVEPTLNNANARVAGAETQVAAVQPTLAAGQTQVAGIEPTLQAANSRVDVAETLVAAVQPTVTAAQVQLGSAQTQVAAVLPTLQAGQTQIAAVEPTLQAADARVNTAGTQVAGIQPTVQAAQSQIDAIVPTLEYAETRAAGVEPTLQAANSRVDVAETQVAAVQPTLTHVNQQALQAEDRVLEANAALTAVVPTLTQVAALLQEGELRQESLRLASAATSILSDPAGNSEVAALLSIRALKATYTQQSDATLVEAMDRLVTRQIFKPERAGRILAVEFTPDDRYGITGSQDNRIRIWDVQTGEIERVLEGHTEDIWSLAVSADGRYLLSGSLDRTARLWDITTGEQIALLDTFAGIVTSVAFSTDGTIMAAGDSDGTVTVWDVETRQSRYSFQHHMNYDNKIGIFFSPDERYILTTSYSNIELRLSSTGAFVRNFVNDFSPDAVTFSSDGSRITFIKGDASLGIIDIEDGSLIQDPGMLISGQGMSFAFSPQGDMYAAGTLDGLIHIRSTTDNSLIMTLLGHGSTVLTDAAVEDVVFSSDGSLLLSASQDGTARLWKVKNQSSSELLRTENATGFFDISHDGNSLAVVQRDGIFSLVDTASREIIYTKQVVQESEDGWIDSVRFSPDDVYLAVAVSATAYEYQDGKFTIQIYAARSGRGKLLHVLEGHTTPVSVIAFSADSRKVLTLSSITSNNRPPDNIVRIWDTASGELLTVLETPDTVYNAAFSQSGEQVFTVHGGGLRVWDLSSRSLLHEHAVRVTDFSENGQYFVSPNDDYSIILFEITAGAEIKERARFSGHTSGVFGSVFSSDYRYLVTASNDNSYRVWDVATGREMRVIQRLEYLNNYFAFWPTQNRYFIAAEYMQDMKNTWSLKMWEVNVSDLIDRACQMVFRDLTQDERNLYGIRDSNPTCPQFEG